ncbi:uncharacterized protein SPSK_04259 [Sporothrix schenckii 1099-18]|uniref:Epidermal growth factor receptor-like transmembrane-juxtamembrane segment domain-containing protein n=2 Tax=Sporothrix schenckii TaxID=29908 RepID=U7PUW8_SPOS1|nr:uncharacterized protein SPSK_04259 [Sporothrix schenckii 1099-18]ERS99408.1 hypothetical protein HMPREF1624_04608 [Sporothrix schenckii ATCC 58251]KJR82869.1 hypothetical protein SPSK_04259 [Sporothrix schenckii 1099-18]
MKQFAHVATAVAAAACLATAAEARRSALYDHHNVERNWQPPVETAIAAAVLIAAGEGYGDAESSFQAAMHDYVDAPEPPATTPPPALDPRFIAKRHTTDNTCAYLSGISSISLYCETYQECVANSINKFAGCCPDTSTACPLPTTCYPSSKHSLYTTSNGYTLWCGDSAYPECVTHYYADSVFSGYTLLGCGKTQAVDKVWFLPTSASSSISSSLSSSSPSSSSSSKSTKSPTTSSDSTASNSASSSSSPDGGGNGGGNNGKKSNTGAIAGGVVGGVAGLGLIGLGAFFLLRRSNQNKVNNNGNNAGGAPPPMGQPQQGPYYGGPGGDPAGYAAGGAAAGVGAAAYHDPNNQYAGYSPQQSPPLQQDAKAYDPYLSNGQQQPFDPNTPSAAGSPPLAQGPQAGAYNAAAVAPAGAGHISPNETISPYSAPPPQPGMGFHSGPVPATLDVAELPTERNDGELRELA